ncbi:short chain dehydrogenase KR domain [Trypanosoma vivax]|uniref:Putative short chain dehydrogenase/reductase n=1 Tax=Trypanosoma vivax (strain Y486) TaxID=1055687 RepID=G0U1N6_TRYVY|nr:putative short chain dehydrogenase/reductase [Trypanosoma vivax]KAH8616908.1 short chain dehydrogenase KR domain [Trypanosoma vivax]CCC49993.1 putative short chain dehydrogenase/reductase [Trypanosoma vivax Y486]
MLHRVVRGLGLHGNAAEGVARLSCRQAALMTLARFESSVTPGPKASDAKVHALSKNKGDACAYAGYDDFASYSALRHNGYLLMHSRRLWLPGVMLLLHSFLGPQYLTSWMAEGLYWSACVLVQRINVRGRTNRVRKDLADKVCVVTGGTSGIGLHTAMQLWNMGARVVIASRPGHETRTREFFRVHSRLDADSAEKALDERLTFVALDLSDQVNIMACAAKLEGMLNGRIDILVNCAAVWLEEPGLTKSGFEEHIGINFLGPFHFTEALLPSLRRSRRGGRVVYVTCASHNGVRRGNVVQERMTLKPSEEAQQLTARCYSASKLGNVYHVQSIAERHYEGIPLNKPSDLRPVVACAADPGFCSTGIVWRESAPLLGMGFIARALRSLLLKTGSEGSQTVVNCCVRDDLEIGGYYAECTLMPSGLSRRAHCAKSRREVIYWAMGKTTGRYHTMTPRVVSEGGTEGQGP